MIKEALDKQLPVILENLKKLGDGNHDPNLKKYVVDEVTALVDADDSFRESYRKWDDRIEELSGICRSESHRSGSSVEGAMLARCFQNKDNWREIEVDVMFKVFCIPQERSHLLEPVNEKPGFIRLPLNKELLYSHVYNECVKMHLEHNMDVSYSPGIIPQYISPIVIRDTWLEQHRNSQKEHSILKKNTTFSKTATTVEERNIFGGLFDLSVDIVPAVRLHFWPLQAAVWIIRPRLWPPQTTIQSIVNNGCQVVPRSSPGGDEHTEWRLSFSIPEVILAQLRTNEQKQVYYFFKMFFYRYLKCVESSEPEGKALYSYVIKTTMLWAQEEIPPADSIWASLENSVQMLLYKLLGSLETGFLPHYFIPEINLLERIGQDVKNQCIGIISRWQSNILMTAPFDMAEKREWINLMRNLHSYWYECLNSKGMMRAWASMSNHLGDAKFASVLNSFSQRL